MATSFQRTRKWKFIYMGIILLLLIAALFHRIYLIAPAAEKNNLTETSLGDVDLGGSLSRFLLSSFRGPLVCGMWWEALERQKVHDFTQLDVLIRGLTKLQPHFRQPWRYQAWNLAYNVAVEFDRAQDKYFYITKGVRWLIEGEKINRTQLYDPVEDKIRTVPDPEMREEIAMHTANKMYYADENAIYRPFFQMSCIPFIRRDPDRMKASPTELEDFKKQYPRFVRRVKLYRMLPDGDEVELNRELLEFLDVYRDLPCVWEMSSDTSKPKTKSKDPWPQWPEAFEARNMIQTDDEKFQEGLDFAYWWYLYSTENAPKGETDLTKADVIPKETTFNKIAKNKHSMIFKANPSRTLSRAALKMNEEGWSTEAEEYWNRAYNSWLELGRANGLEPGDDLRRKLMILGKAYQDNYPQRASGYLPPPEYLKGEELAQATEMYKGYNFMNNYNKMTGFCRYDHWKLLSDVARRPEYRESHQAKFLAERRKSDWPYAIDQYSKAIGLYSQLVFPEASKEQQIAFRLSLLSPSFGTAVMQVAPPLRRDGVLNISQQPFATNDMAQEQMIELQGNYNYLRAKQLAPRQIRQEYIYWNLKPLLRTAASMGDATSASWLDLVPSPRTNILIVEDALEDMRGVLDPLITQEAREREKERQKEIRRR